MCAPETYGYVVAEKRAPVAVLKGASLNVKSCKKVKRITVHFLSLCDRLAERAGIPVIVKEQLVDGNVVAEAELGFMLSKKPEGVEKA